MGNSLNGESTEDRRAAAERGDLAGESGNRRIDQSPQLCTTDLDVDAVSHQEIITIQPRSTNLDAEVAERRAENVIIQLGLRRRVMCVVFYL